jgi:hypothetical protein
MKKNGFAAILIILAILVFGAIGYFSYKYISKGGFLTYQNSNYIFSLNYPAKWFVSELGKDVLTSPGVYFSPEKIDFSNTNYQASKGFVRISVFNTKDMFRNPKYASVVYTSAKQLLDAMQSEEKDSVKAGNLPSTPGPDTYKDAPEKKFIDGAISVNDVAALGSHDYMYWFVNNGKLYEFLAVYPVTQKDLSDFDKNIDTMTSTFRISN